MRFQLEIPILQTLKNETIRLWMRPVASQLLEYQVFTGELKGKTRLFNKDPEKPSLTIVDHLLGRKL